MIAVEKLDRETVKRAEEEIGAMVQQQQELWNRHDAQGLTALFTETADLVNVIGKHRKGRAEIFEEYDGLHRSIMKDSVLKMLAWRIKLLKPDVAIVHVNWEMTGVQKMPGWNVPDVRHGVITWVAVKQSGQWKFEAFANAEEIPVVAPKEMKGY
jgi:uncharacterized protein (TIGR02246 family)